MSKHHHQQKRINIGLYIGGFVVLVALLFLLFLMERFTYGSESNTLKILVVSDIHLTFSNIDRMRSEINTPIDVVLLSGDMCSLWDTEYTDEKALSKALQDISTIIQQLQKISKKVYYIPGNHDPLVLFDSDNKKSGIEYGTNIHNRAVKLIDGLVLAGFGGSVPGIYNDDKSVIWTGYPYNTDNEYEHVFVPFMNNVVLSSSYSNDAILLMTHVGPVESDTTKVREKVADEDNKYRMIMSGSTITQTQLERSIVQNKVILNVHGHTHDATGHAMLYNIPVVNPGPLKYGHYTIVSLKRKDSQQSNSWYAHNIEFHQFPVERTTPW
jgi:Icc-related predicted phosphoesterase